MLSFATQSSLSFAGPMPVGAMNIRMQATPPAPAPSPMFSVKNLPGISGPLGLFDPLGFCEDASEGKVKFYRGEPARPFRPALRPHPAQRLHRAAARDVATLSILRFCAEHAADRRLSDPLQRLS